MFLGEAPGRTEDQQGIPFVGKTGQELDNLYLPLAQIPRSEIYVANAAMCSHKDYHNPTPDEALACASVHLGETLSRVKPEILVPMGAVACSLFDITDMIQEHGIPRPAKWESWSGTLIPFYHPSAGMRSTGYMLALTRDFYELGLTLKNGVEYPSDSYHDPDYRVCRTEGDVDDYFRPFLPRDSKATLPPIPLFLGEDTESLPDGSPFCLTFSHTPGTGRLIYVHNTELTARYRLLRSILNLHSLFHNYLHDVEIYDRLELPIVDFTDTMVRAYNLCLGGGGDEEESRAGIGSLSLKVLAYRHLAMRMTSFKDTVYPHSIPKVLSWLWQAEEIFRPEKKKKGKGAAKLTPDEKSLNQSYLKITNLIQSLESGSDVDPWKRMKDWPENEVGMIEGVLGKAPVPSIEHVPENELVVYACRDADATLRLNRFLDTYKPWIWLD